MAVIYATPGEASAVFSAPTSSRAMDVIRGSVQAFRDAIPNIPQYVDERVNQYCNAVFGQDIGRRVQALRNYVSHAFDGNEIRPLYSLDDVQHAPPVMQRYIMADPMVREYYHQGRIEGYGDQYVDADPGCIGRDHYDYRRATDGLILENSETGKLESHTYIELLRGDDQHLTPMQKLSIALARQNAQDAILEGDDPTSVWNSPVA